MQRSRGARRDKQAERSHMETKTHSYKGDKQKNRKAIIQGKKRAVIQEEIKTKTENLPDRKKYKRASRKAGKGKDVRQGEQVTREEQI